MGDDTEILLKPVYYTTNPFFENNAYLVLCETYDSSNKPLNNNYRPQANKIFEEKKDLQPWYGYEQEYFIINPDTNLPLGFNHENKQGQYYCSVGTGNSFGREISDEHLLKCIQANLNISGTNAEVAPGQWEYQIGPVEGINGCDQLLVSRYILIKIAEKHNLLINFEPKPIKGDWNGSGCHTNFSTILMREGLNNKTGLDYIYECINNLEKSCQESIKIYGENNNERLTGKHETSDLNYFTYGIGTRNTSIRIGNEIFKTKYGYFEDRRPSSNMNPYLVSSYLLSNC